jgi:hypothetical protein
VGLVHLPTLICESNTTHSVVIRLQQLLGDARRVAVDMVVCCVDGQPFYRVRHRRVFFVGNDRCNLKENKVNDDVRNVLAVDCSARAVTIATATSRPLVSVPVVRTRLGRIAE